ncbi:MAG: ABC transporter ATP-binding protein [Opitutales bacterium]
MSTPAHTQADDAPIFELSAIARHYKMGDSTVRALDGVDLKIQSGDYAAILGPSGSGKSTLMHLLGFMDRPSEGTMHFEGKNVSRLSAARRAWYRSNRIGFIFQAFNLLPRLSVLDNVLLPLSYARAHIEKRKDKALEALSRVGMDHRAGHIPNQLSGGERQRVAIARALINDPALILADEPTGNLDSKNVERIMQLFDQLIREGQTLIMVTHDQNVADHTHRILRMLDGKLVADEATRSTPSVFSALTK